MTASHPHWNFLHRSASYAFTRPVRFVTAEGKRIICGKNPPEQLRPAVGNSRIPARPRGIAPWQYQYVFLISRGRAVDANAALNTLSSSDSTPPAAVGQFSFNNGNLFPTYGLSWTAPGDDGNSGTVAAYELRFSDNAIITPAQFDLATPLPGAVPEPANGFQHETVRVPYRHTSGYISIRGVDKVGNAGPISSLPLSIPAGLGDPYTVTESAASPLSTGGTPLGLKADDDFKSVSLPFSFQFFEGTWYGVTVSTNGALYLPAVLFSTRDSRGSVNSLSGYRMIAPAWDDLRTDRRPGDDVYVVTPDENRIIFRWQAVTFNSQIDAAGTTRR